MSDQCDVFRLTTPANFLNEFLTVKGHNSDTNVETMGDGTEQNLNKYYPRLRMIQMGYRAVFNALHKHEMVYKSPNFSYLSSKRYNLNRQNGVDVIGHSRY